MNRDSEPARVARRVRGWLHQHLARETRVVTGPPLKPPERVIEETLRDLSLRRALAAIAREKGRDAASVEEEARKALRKVAPRSHQLAVHLHQGFLNFFFH